MNAPNTAAEIGREVVERMVTLVRELHADHVKHGAHDYVQDFVARTAAIVALLPEPVDPDLVEARAIASEWSKVQHGLGRDYTTGLYDDEPGLQAVLAGIKRGRGLALKARAVGEGENRG